MLVRLEQRPAEALHQVSLHGGCLSLGGFQRSSVVLFGRIKIPLGKRRFGGELWLGVARVPLKERILALRYEYYKSIEHNQKRIRGNNNTRNDIHLI